MRRSVQAAAFWIPVLGFASAAMACAGGHGPPDRFSAYPGLTIIRPDLILLYPVLSGTLERPFYSRAGYTTNTWAFSIQANFLAYLASSAVGLGLSIVFYNSSLFWLAMLIAPAIGLLVKRSWFSKVPRELDRVHESGLFLLASVLSTGLIASLPFWMNLFGTDRQSWASQVNALKIAVSFVLFFAMIVLHVHLFATHRRQPVADRRRGFEILPTKEATNTPIPVATLAR